jgi:hypothetical protein
MEGRLTGQQAGRWRARPGVAVAREARVGGQTREHPAVVAGSGLQGHCRQRRVAQVAATAAVRRGIGWWWRTWALAGGAGWVVRLGLDVNGPAGCGNREKVYFWWPIRVSAAR